MKELKLKPQGEQLHMEALQDIATCYRIVQRHALNGFLPLSEGACEIALDGLRRMAADLDTLPEDV